MLGVERHLLDEPEGVAAVEAPPEQVGHPVVVDAAHRDGVDLDRGEPGVRGGLEPGLDVLEPVAPGEVAELLRVDGVEADVDAVQPGGGQGRGEAVQADAVGRHRDPGPRLERGDPADDVDEAAPQDGLAAGEPHVRDAQADHDPHEAHQLVVGEHLGLAAASPGPRPACSRCTGGCSGR